MSEFDYPEVTTIIIAIQNPKGSGSLVMELGESYMSVFNKLFPIQPPTSSLESRANLTFALTDGRRVAIPVPVALVFEGRVDDWENL